MGIHFYSGAGRLGSEKARKVRTAQIEATKAIYNNIENTNCIVRVTWSSGNEGMDEDVYKL